MTTHMPKPLLLLLRPPAALWLGLGLALALPAGASRAAVAEPYLRIESFSHSEPVSIHAFVHDWDGPLAQGSDALTHNSLETGVRYGAFSLAYVQDDDYEIKASRDTAELYYLARNHRDLPVGARYELRLRASQQRSQGLRLAYMLNPLPSLSLEPALSLLHGESLIDGQLSGTAVVNGPKDYSYAAQVNEFYSEDALFGRHAAAPGGLGYSLDLHLNWRIKPAVTADLQLRHLLGELAWRNAPYTSAIASSDSKQFDADGYAHFNPVLHGVEGYARHTQRLHPRALLAVDWRWAPQDTLGLRLRLTEVREYLSLRAERRYAGCLALNAEVIPEPFALGAGAACGPFALSLLSDRLRVEDAHLLQLNATLGWAF